MISLKKICKAYKSGDQVINALDSVDLDISPGEFVSVTGKSGSGKSTLLNILGCLDRADSGNYFLQAKDVSSLNDDLLSSIRNSQFGFVFQAFHLLSSQTALENVLLPRRFHEEGLRPADHRRARELLGKLGLADRAEHKPNGLSGGQRQRVAIARALINSPRVLLADEPTGNLDSKTSGSIMELLQSFNRAGQTIVLVTHDAQIASFAQRLIHMEDGKIVEIQTTS